MKYEIEGIERSRTIKSIQVIKKKVNRAIMVNYLDGTQDVFEFTKENLSTIESIMNEQAQEFIKKNDPKTYETMKKILTTLSVIGGIAGLSLVAFDILGPAIIALALGAGSLVLDAETIKKENYAKKYKLYLDSTRNKIKEYEDILAIESMLTNTKKGTNKLRDIDSLDKVSLKYVESVETKVNRYSDINKPKTKTLENSSLH